MDQLKIQGILGPHWWIRLKQGRNFKDDELKHLEKNRNQNEYVYFLRKIPFMF